MSTGNRTTKVARWTAAAAVALAAAVVVVVLLGGAGPYKLRAHFLDASQLVDGGTVRLAGRTVGHIDDIGLTPAGEADVVLSLDDSNLVPLHEGTRLTIRALSQSGVANRYIEISPGATSAPALPSGSTLTTDQTSSMVSLDAILDSFGPTQRHGLEQLIAHASRIYAGSGARYFNAMLGRLDPALVELDATAGEIASDRAALAALVPTASDAAGAIASRGTDLRNAVANTSTLLRSVAAARAPLADAIARAPGVLVQARKTLADARSAVSALTPVLHEVPPVTAALGPLLQRLASVLPEAAPTIGALRGELPGLAASLLGLQQIAGVSVTALHSAARALLVARPIVRAIRYYGSDLLLGVFDGLLGVATANYDRWGHYVRAEFVEPYQSALGGPLGELLSHPLTPSLFSLRTRLLRRCPGGNAPPAPDGSNPWIPDPSICTPADDVPASVNTP
jgi:phospholipid/cholesterol/gamma-HCH transport system substrate-binding protein